VPPLSSHPVSLADAALPPIEVPATVDIQPGSPRQSAVLAAVKQYWGFDSLRPLQHDAINACLDGADSLTVMPTGGGKSLCYQVPPLVTGRITLVVSPLIALMKDQVGGLEVAGYPAAALHSHLSPQEKTSIRQRIQSRELRLLLTSPERLLSDGFVPFLQRLNVGAIAIDEAHCISQWGHDFRPEYRRMAELRAFFPGVPINAFTATATPPVQEDIVAQLGLKNPRVMIGIFDRPNLTYRVLPRVDRTRQCVEAVRRHPDAAAIIYCISRKDTDSLADDLVQNGIKAKAYHAGMDADSRSQISDDFRSERLSVVVATVAFGMGIDRGDVRLVVHAALPKSIEHYQQETGRAGRDGLPAECLLLYSAGDVMKWKQVMARGASETGSPPQVLAHQESLLDEMQRLVSGARCRHKAISEYFGQPFEKPDCGACDFCLRELETIEASHETAQKILSCVARCGQSFGARHVIDVLLGSQNQKVMEKGHNTLSTFGLLRGTERNLLTSFIDQLIDSGDLERAPGEFPVLRLTSRSRELLRSERRAALVRPRSEIGRSQRETAATAMLGRPLSVEEHALFESLRHLRREIAEGLSIPPYQVFNDATLEEFCRVRPSTQDGFICVRGVGVRKLEQFGDRFIGAIVAHCRTHGLAVDAQAGSRPRRMPDEASSTGGGRDTRPREMTVAKRRAVDMFRRGSSIEEVSAAIGRAPSTLCDDLVEYIMAEKPATVGPWVPDSLYQEVAHACTAAAGTRLRPIKDILGEAATYEQIRIVLAHRKTQGHES